MAFYGSLLKALVDVFPELRFQEDKFKNKPSRLSLREKSEREKMKIERVRIRREILSNLKTQKVANKTGAPL